MFCCSNTHSDKIVDLIGGGIPNVLGQAHSALIRPVRKSSKGQSDALDLLIFPRASAIAEAPSKSTSGLGLASSITQSIFLSELEARCLSLAFREIVKKLDEQKTDLLSQIERWAPEMLSHKPTPADWSVLEMLDHIIKTEIEILSAARTGLANPHRIGISDRLRTRFLEKIFASDRKVKVPPSARQVLPGSDLQLEDLRKRWNESREELNEFVSRGDSRLLRQGIFRHPVGGWMGVTQILRFFSVHLIHHRYQLNRIARSAVSNKT